MKTLDLTDREAIQRPYPIYASMREELPVHWNPSLKGWFVSRHADVRSALMYPDLSVEKIHGFGASGRALQAGRELQVADLDRAMRRLDAQVGGESAREAGRAVHDREEQRVRGPFACVEPRAKLPDRPERSVGQVGPHATLAIERVRIVESGGVNRGIERRESAMAALEYRSRGSRRGCPAGQGRPDGLAERVHAATPSANCRAARRAYSSFPRTSSACVPWATIRP